MEYRIEYRPKERRKIIDEYLNLTRTRIPNRDLYTDYGPSGKIGYAISDIESIAQAANNLITLRTVVNNFLEKDKPVPYGVLDRLRESHDTLDVALLSIDEFLKSLKNRCDNYLSRPHFSSESKKSVTALQDFLVTRGPLSRANFDIKTFKAILARSGFSNLSGDRAETLAFHSRSKLPDSLFNPLEKEILLTLLPLCNEYLKNENAKWFGKDITGIAKISEFKGVLLDYLQDPDIGKDLSRLIDENYDLLIPYYEERPDLKDLDSVKRVAKKEQHELEFINQALCKWESLFKEGFDYLVSEAIALHSKLLEYRDAPVGSVFKQTRYREVIENYRSVIRILPRFEIGDFVSYFSDEKVPATKYESLFKEMPDPSKPLENQRREFIETALIPYCSDPEFTQAALGFTEAANLKDAVKAYLRLNRSERGTASCEQELLQRINKCYRTAAGLLGFSIPNFHAYFPPTEPLDSTTGLSELYELSPPAGGAGRAPAGSDYSVESQAAFSLGRSEETSRLSSPEPDEIAIPGELSAPTAASPLPKLFSQTFSSEMALTVNPEASSPGIAADEKTALLLFKKALEELPAPPTGFHTISTPFFDKATVSTAPKDASAKMTRSAIPS